MKANYIDKLVKWYDKYLFEVLAGFLILFIPLYPKWPLLDVLPGYIVRVRLEDILVALILGLTLIQFARKKVKFTWSWLFKAIGLYLVIGLLSSLSAIFITQTVPMELSHIGKLLFHWARRVEYMSLALVFFLGVKSKQSVIRLISLMAVAGLLVSLYGYGQRYLEWPVYSTMNREFAKGWRLVLTEHARVSSTFAGHYDLAAYTIFILMLMASVFTLAKRHWHRFAALLGFITVFGTLLLTGSRTSFIAYAAALLTLAILLIPKITWRRTWTVALVLFVISFIGFRSYGTMYMRFAQIFKLDIAEQYVVGTVFPQLKSQTLDRIEFLKSKDRTTTPSDKPPSIASNPTPEPDSDSEADNDPNRRPADVFADIPESFPESTLSGIPDSAGSGEEGKDRVYSETSANVGLSAAIRYEALWPRALSAFKTNPFLGTGYSTLVKTQVTDFTEAESTDNDYLRNLGETGILGLVSFFGIIVWSIYLAIRAQRQTKDTAWIIFYSVVAASLVGLMVNALYIDIFVSSKIAYMVWALLGMLYASFYISKVKLPNK